MLLACVALLSVLVSCCLQIVEAISNIRDTWDGPAVSLQETLSVVACQRQWQFLLGLSVTGFVSDNLRQLLAGGNKQQSRQCHHCGWQLVDKVPSWRSAELELSA